MGRRSEERKTVRFSHTSCVARIAPRLPVTSEQCRSEHPVRGRLLPCRDCRTRVVVVGATVRCGVGGPIHGTLDGLTTHHSRPRERLHRLVSGLLWLGCRRPWLRRGAGPARRPSHHAYATHVHCTDTDADAMRQAGSAPKKPPAQPVPAAAPGRPTRPEGRRRSLRTPAIRNCRSTASRCPFWPCCLGRRRSARPTVLTSVHDVLPVNGLNGGDSSSGVVKRTNAHACPLRLPPSSETPPRRRRALEIWTSGSPRLSRAGPRRRTLHGGAVVLGGGCAGISKVGEGSAARLVSMGLVLVTPSGADGPGHSN